MKYTLNGTWKFDFTMPKTGEHKSLTSVVPGNVEIPLMENGIIGDCMPADTIHATTAFDYVDDWTYTRTFDAPEVQDGWSCDLVFEGIDTIADIYLNGDKIYEALSMQMTHRIDVRGKLKDKDNELKVVIRSAILWERAHGDDAVMMIPAHTDEKNGTHYLRKARHEWGWDNAPRLLTSGIFRSVYLETLPPERFDQVYLYTRDIRDGKVNCGIRWCFTTPVADLTGYSIRYTLMAEDKQIRCIEREVVYPKGALNLTLSLEEVRLWWPRGFGEQFLHDVKLEMLVGGEVISTWESKWGIRIVRVDRTDDVMLDGSGGEFQFYVNNEKIYLNGTNWKPLDALHSRADEKVERALDLAYDLNCNMIRVWGGGIYEDTPFFDYCDRRGILIWQDFMFACEVPPYDEWYLELCKRETRQIIEKLRNHACLAIWCGDNENDMFMRGLNAFSPNALPSKNKLTRQVIPELICQFDPFRYYVPSSPVFSDEGVIDRIWGKNERMQSETHMYPATNIQQRHLRSDRSKFIGETGPIGMNPFTLNKAIYEHEKERLARIWNAPWSWQPHEYFLDMHQTDSYMITKRHHAASECKKWFGRDFSFEEFFDFAFGVNVVCSHVYKDIIEFCRTDRWTKTGVLWWSMLDMWPMICNYSVVDSDFQKKMTYYWIRQAQQPFGLMIVRRKMDGPLALYYANDTLSEHTGSYRIWSIDQKGERRDVACGSYAGKPNGAEVLQSVADTEDTELYVIEWQEDGKTYYNHFATASQHADIAVWHMWSDELDRLYGADHYE